VRTNRMPTAPGSRLTGDRGGDECRFDPSSSKHRSSHHVGDRAGHAPGSLRLSCKTQVLPSGSLKSANEA
jgi:hypothetical protein